MTRTGARRDVRGLGQTWRALLARLGMPYRNPHQLRHSVATAGIAAGVPLPDLAAYLGDRVESLVKTYLHRAGIDPAGVLDRLFAGG